MTLTEALILIFNDGPRITRLKWNNRSVYCGLDSGLLCIKGFSSSGPDDGKWHPWTITEEDYFADDWEVVE